MHALSYKGAALRVPHEKKHGTKMYYYYYYHGKLFGYCSFTTNTVDKLWLL